MSSAWTEQFIAWGLVLGTWALTGGCSLPKPAPVTVHEGAYDLVTLDSLSGETPARHPVRLDPRVMETILHGIYIQEDERLLQRLLSGRQPLIPVFSDEQSATVSRFLVTALAQASPQQHVVFSLGHPRSQGAETTQAELYCAEPFLYFTLRQFHDGAPHASGETSGRHLPDRTGLGSRRLVFQLPAYSGSMVENGSPTTLIIHYVQIEQLLASRAATDITITGHVSPAPSLTTIEKTGPEEPNQASIGRTTPSLNELIVRKDLEVESLKEEIRTLRRALEVQQRDVTRLKRQLDNMRQP